MGCASSVPEDDNAVEPNGRRPKTGQSNRKIDTAATGLTTPTELTLLAGYGKIDEKNVIQER